MFSFPSPINIYFQGLNLGAVSYPYFTPEFFSEASRFSTRLESRGRAIGDDPPWPPKTDERGLVFPVTPPLWEFEDPLDTPQEGGEISPVFWGSKLLKAWAVFFDCLLQCDIDRDSLTNPPCWGTGTNSSPCNCNGPDCISQLNIPRSIGRPDPPTFPCCEESGGCVEEECERLTGHPWCIPNPDLINPEYPYDEGSKALARVLCWERIYRQWRYRWGSDAEGGCWGCLNRVFAECTNICNGKKPGGPQPPDHLILPYRKGGGLVGPPSP